MNPEKTVNDLFRLMEQWRALTHAETESIRGGDWQNLERLHARKVQLQEKIQRAEQAVFAGDVLSAERRTAERQRLRQIASELERLETENRDLLMRRLEETDEQLKAGNKTISGLRGVQKAYGTGGAGSFWQAYS